jgi:hypothetical protein
MRNKTAVIKTVEKLTGKPYEWSKEEIEKMIKTSDKAVERGILAIYNKQTEMEKATRETMVYNNVGFNASHARLGSYYANWISSGKHLDGKHLEKGRKLILHYATQLTLISNKKI